MEQLKPMEINRIGRDMEAWKRVEVKLAGRYGRKILYDRDFLKVKREIYKHIRAKYKNKRLNLFEKAEMRILRGQRRNLLRQLYPNPFVRLTRNLLVFAANVLVLIGRLLLKAATPLFAPIPRQVFTPAYAGTRATNQKKPDNTKNIHQKQQTKKTVAQAKAIVRKLPVKARVQMPATQKPGLKK